MWEAQISRQFEKQVAERQEGQPVSEAAITIQHGDNCLSVRLAGGFILEGMLENNKGQVVPVFYSEPDHTTAKLRASHDMSPAGASDDIGGQHGIYRWADYEVVEQKPDFLRLTAMVPDDYVSLEKSFRVGERSLHITSRLYNGTDQPIDTSLGHHLYWSMPKGEVGHPQLIPTNIDTPFADPAVRDAVIRGDSRYWSGFEGNVSVLIPGSGTFGLKATAETIAPHGGGEVPCQVGLMLWHLVGTKSFCIEPVVGNENDHNQLVRPSSEVPNRQLYLAPGAAVELQTVITAG